MVKVDKDEAKRQLEMLPEILKADHWISLRFPDTMKDIKTSVFPDVLSFLEEIGVENRHLSRPFKWSEKGRQVTFSFGVGSALDLSFNGLVLGPDPAAVLQADRFRNLWGRNRCQLRRFQDGTVKESVQIFPLAKNVEDTPIEVDAADFVLNKFNHLLQVHFPDVELIVERPLSGDRLNEALERRKATQSLREKARVLISVIQKCAGDELPIKRASAECGCLHGGHHPRRHFPDMTDCQENGEMKERSPHVPRRLDSLPVYLDITSKKNFNEDLFVRLSQFHLMNLKAALTENNQFHCFITANTLVVNFQGVSFGIKVRSMNNASGDDGVRRDDALGEMLQNIGTDHPCWWGALSLIHEWAESHFLFPEVEERILDLILAVAIVGSPSGDGAEKLITPPAPSSVDSAFLRFLYLLSFGDFKDTAFVLNKEDCKEVSKTIASFFLNRSPFPPMTIITPHDSSPSYFTRKLTPIAFKRIVNQSRKTLFSVLKSDTPSFTNAFHTGHEAFDLVVKLKGHTKVEKSSSGVKQCVADFDAYSCYLEELTAAFSNSAKFHLNRRDRVVGVKVFDETDIDAIAEDVKILGKGVVSDVILIH